LAGAFQIMLAPLPAHRMTSFLPRRTEPTYEDTEFGEMMYPTTNNVVDNFMTMGYQFAFLACINSARRYMAVLAESPDGAIFADSQKYLT
jgi:hypothetical protein